MTTLFGQNGQPVGSIDEDAYYDKQGRQLGELHDGYLFSSISNEEVSKDEFVGSFVNGVVYNARGYPQAFVLGARPGLGLVPPKIRSTLTARLLGIGPDVREEGPASIPSFLREKLVGHLPHLDGIFS